MTKSIKLLTCSKVKMFALAFILGLVGCTGTGTVKTPNSPELSQSLSANSYTPSKYPITIQDFAGREIIIDKEPLKVISIAPSITELIFALGVEDKLAARTDYCDYPPEIVDYESIGALQTPDIERIVEINPDLVMVSTHFSKENAETLEGMSINVLALKEDESFEGSYKFIEKVGQVLNCEAKAEVLITEMMAAVSDITSQAAELERPSVYYVVDFGEYGDFTATGDTFISSMIEMAGGENIAAGAVGWQYNLESLLEADPDLIIVSDKYNSKETFMSSEGYKNLTAVKTGNVYEIDNNMLDRQGVRNADGLLALARIIHPEAFE